MGVSLTDVLIELSDPSVMNEFRKNPKSFLLKRELDPAERSALLSGSLEELFRAAKSAESNDPDQQFNKLSHTEVGTSIGPSFDLVLDHNDIIAVHPETLVFVDGNGVLFKACVAD